MKVSVKLTPEAEIQIEELAAWWREKRSSAPSLKRQLSMALRGISRFPRGAPVYLTLDDVEVRRVRVKKTPSMIYYYVDVDSMTAFVISVWSAQRGEDPPLK